jgi:MFS family permease
MSARDALRNPAFRRLQGARLASVLAMQMVSVAVGWQVYEATRRPIDLGYVGLVQFLPVLLLWPVTGAVADRSDRTKVLVRCSLGLVLGVGALLALTLTGGVQVGQAPWGIYGVLVGLAAARAFSGPAGAALLPRLVSPEELAPAVALASSTFQVGTVAGPALGGIVYAAGGPAAVYGSALGLLVLGVSLQLGLPSAPGEAREAGGARGLGELLAGLAYVRSRPVLLGAITLDLFAVLLGGAVALLPVYARDILGAGPTGLGALRASPAVGAAVTAAYLSVRPIRGRAGRVLLVTVAIFGLATIGFGLSRSMALSLGMLFVLGVADEVSVVIRQTLVQVRTPDAMRGRVSALNLLFVGMSNEVGELESGVAAQWLGPVNAVVLGGVGTLIVVALAAWRAPALRDVDRLEDT